MLTLLLSLSTSYHHYSACVLARETAWGWGGASIKPKLYYFAALLKDEFPHLDSIPDFCQMINQIIHRLHWDVSFADHAKEGRYLLVASGTLDPRRRRRERGRSRGQGASDA